MQSGLKSWNCTSTCITIELAEHSGSYVQCWRQLCATAGQCPAPRAKESDRTGAYKKKLRMNYLKITEIQDVGVQQ